MIQRATQTRQFGPADHGRRLTYDQYLAGEFAEGFKYELIDGALFVSPEANPTHSWVEVWLMAQLLKYSTEHPEVINHVNNKARVFVPGRVDLTAPEPDVAAYQDFPRGRPSLRVRWENFSPVLVAEVISPRGEEKDLVRNVELYWQVPSIKEYWVFDLRPEAQHPLFVYRRQATKWKVLRKAPGETYTTRLLPGFALQVESNEEPDETEE